ncbi:MAG TPA: hypothetical protein VFP98_06005 [Candidatus Polarisedimenticolia bacterium]|nr:hypothetical protein [Candidatus Polarisedimenticolia bacterium]
MMVAFFTALHLLNLGAAVEGPVAFGNLRALLRRYYQAPAVEIPLLWLPILFNVVSGLLLGASRDVPARSRTVRTALQRFSGLALVALLPLHVLGTRGLELAARVDPDFHFVARSLGGAGGPLFAAAYALLALAAPYHIANGLFTQLDAAGALGDGRGRVAAGASLAVAGASLALCGLLGLFSFLGVLYPRGLEALPAPDRQAW